ncbi:hypothetical protein CUR178_05453 [Leishmania enriettii]|uniref:Uncharacterized protein n=1 Tax=Leishmania enriettii TaxID=5663 RepID=A0A836GBG0_LEIEN|nr:hypothetical protein CUR178_05453 [Leishmania enriettii]
MDFQMPTEVAGRILKQYGKGTVISFIGDMTFEAQGGVALASFFFLLRRLLSRPCTSPRRREGCGWMICACP